jgi:hypothetical protein
MLMQIQIGHTGISPMLLGQFRKNIGSATSRQ